MNPELENEVVRRWQQGASRRRIARELRISRDSVAKVLGDHQQGRATGRPHPELPTPRQRRGSIVDAYVTRMEELLARWPQITAVRVHEDAQGWLPRRLQHGAGSTARTAAQASAGAGAPL